MEEPQYQFGPVAVYLGEKSGKYPDGNQVVVTGTDSKVVFDTPLSSTGLGEVLAGSDMVLLGHVHEDHVCGLRQLPDTPVFAPEEDVAALRSLEGMRSHYGYADAAWPPMLAHIEEDFHFQPRPDARGYGDGQVWELGGCRVRALHMPGHTGGHSVLLVEPQGVAFIGDIDLTGFGPYYGDACSDLARFEDTLERIEEMEANVWITFHHKAVLTERAEFLRLLHAFKQKIRDREAAILAAIGERGRTLPELVAQRFLFPQGFEGIFVEDVERMTIEAHLMALTAQGRVFEENGRFGQRAVG